MTVELIDGHAGSAHISGDDLGNFKAGLAGLDGCVLATDSKLAATLDSANSVTINTGAAIMPTSGRHVRVTAPESVTIESGTQGQNRNDLIVLRATTADDDATVETAALVVIKGTATTGTAADPDIQAGDLKLYRVSLSGISVATPVAQFSVLTPLDDIDTTVTYLGTTSVPKSRTVNGKSPAANVTLAAGDIKMSSGSTLQAAVQALQTFTGSDSGWKLSSVDGGSNNCRYRKIGKLVIVQLEFVKAGSSWTKKLTLPSGYRPAYAAYGALFYASTSAQNGGIRILADGQVQTYGSENSAYWCGAVVFFVD